MIMPSCAISMTLSSTIWTIPTSEPRVMTSLKILSLFPVVLLVRSAVPLRHLTYFAARDHFRGIIVIEEIGLSPPTFQFGRMLRFLFPLFPLSSADTVANAILLSSSGEVPWVTLASISSTVLMVGFLPVRVACFFLSLACRHWLQLLAKCTLCYVLQ